MNIQKLIQIGQWDWARLLERHKTQDDSHGNIKVPTTVLPPEHTILQTWNNGHNNTKKIVSFGYQAIISSSDFYYLDSGHGDFLGNDSQYD